MVEFFNLKFASSFRGTGPRPAGRSRLRNVAAMLPFALASLLIMPAGAGFAAAPAKSKAVQQKRGAAKARVRASARRSPKSKPRAGSRTGGVQVLEANDGTTSLELKGLSKPAFNVHRLANPDRVVVELSGLGRAELPPTLRINNWVVAALRYYPRGAKGSGEGQLTIELARDASYIVVPREDTLVVTLTPRQPPSAEYLAARGLAEAKGQARAELGALTRRKDQAIAERQKAEAATQAAQRVRAEVSREAAKQRLAAETVLDRARRSASASDALREQARGQLEKAEAVLERARRELSAARKAKARADAELTALKNRSAIADKAGKRVEHQRLRAELNRAQAEQVLAARAAGDLAKQLKSAEQARTAATKLLREQAQRRQQLDRLLAAKSARIVELEERVAAGEASLATLRTRPTKAALQASRTKLQRQSAAYAALEDDLRRLEAREATGRSTIAALEARLAAQGKRRRKTDSEVGRKLRAKRAELEQLSQRLDARRADLAVAESQLEGQRQALTQLRSRSQQLKGEERSAKSRRAEQRRVEAEVAKSRAALAKLERSIETHTGRLTNVQGKLAEAERKLKVKVNQPAPKSEPISPSNKRAKARPLAALQDLRFETTNRGHRLQMVLPGKFTWHTAALTPTTVQLTLEGVHVGKAYRQRRDLRNYNGPIDTVTTFQDGDRTRIIVATRDGASGAIVRNEEGLVWNFKLEPDATAVADRSPAAVAAPHALRVKSPEVAGFVGKTPTAMSRGFASRRAAKKWRGDRIDIELQEAPIKDVLLLFSDIGRVNIIAGNGVQGVVSMKLSSVPWDQALDIILRSLSLGMVQEGNVIRVATIGALEEERAKAIERANAQVQLKPLDTRLVPLSYATVEEMVEKVRSVLSPRGSVTPDTRTNTLIIMDVAENIVNAEELIGELDSQTPQVLIEARIVEARTTWLRQLGIQWGFDYIASAGTGNPTGLIFPNSLGVGGGSASSESNTNGLLLGHAAANPNYAVDLPAPAGPGTGGSIGFSFGSIAGNLNTNLRLSAAEDEGEVRLISAPKVVTMDNTQAEIEQGVQIPISQVSSEGVNTRYVNATLALRVTPHVTNEGSVVLDVEVQKNEADFINTGARGDPTILTKQARNRMLIIDGDTAVIGGIYTRNQSTNRKKVPWVAEIPIIGWFFKNRSEVDTRTELLIFLTPKIINRSSSIGG